MERRVQPAAIALMMTSAFSFFLNLAALGIKIFGLSVGSVLGSGPSITDLMMSTWGIAFSGAALFFQAFSFYAGLKMMALEKHNVAVAGAVMALVPFFCCQCTNIPIGIWALVVLLMQDTKSAFSS